MSQALPAVHRYTIGGFQFEARSLPPGLYLIATPIGNLRDVTLRALETLAAADLICCEDTRITSRLLNHYGIAKPLKPYHDHNAAKVRPGLLERLRAGSSIALVSDAGTPLISDPGYKLVLEAIAQGHHIEVIPGPSAPIMAVALSGIPADRFLFAGFLPARRSERLRVLEELRSIPAALVFFEAPSRISDALAAIKTVMGDRPIVIARELTKLHEEVMRGTADELLNDISSRNGLKGEITLVVAPPEDGKAPDPKEIEEALRAALATSPPARAAAEVARRYGVAKKDLYALAMRTKDRAGGGDGSE
jgi:16S rRNA (cytidine1402-2'-O)-methyltransferase